MHWIKELGKTRPERWIRAALLVVIFCIPFSVVLILDQSQAEVAGRYNQFAVPVLYPLELVVLAVAAWWARLRRPDLRPYRWLVPALAVAVLSPIWAPFPLLAGVAAFHLVVAGALLVMLATEFRDGVFLKAAAWTVAAAAGLQVVIGAGQFWLGHDLGLRVLGEGILSTTQPNVAKVGDPARLRAYGTLPHPNLLAAYLAMAIFWVGTVVFWPFRRPAAWKQWAFAILLAALGTGLLLTFSRTALIVVAVNGALVVLFSIRRWRRLPLAAGMAAAGVVLAAGLLSSQLMSRTTLESARETGVSNRAAGYSLAVEMLSDRPLGVGAGSFVTAAPELRDLPAYQYQPAHNAPLLAAAELGAIPALLVLWFVVRTGWQFHFIRPRDPRANTLNFALFALSGTFIALGMTDHFFWSQPQGLWMVCVVLAAVIARLPLARLRQI